MSTLANHVVVVTGGSGLLGRRYCDAITAAGGIAINADLAVETNLDEQCHQLDITSLDSIKELIANVHAQFGRLDGWVNNAYPRTKDWGIRFELTTPESWRQNVDMHLNGYFMCCQQVLEYMKQQGSGSVVNMGSIYGSLGPDFWVYEGTGQTNSAIYAAIKGGVTNLTRYLAAYYGPHGVRVNTLSPGGIFDHQIPSFVERYEHKTPLRRLGTPDDIAPSVVFLLSGDSRYITGHNLIVDGGWSII